MSIVEVGFITFCKEMRYVYDSMASGKCSLSAKDIDEYSNIYNLNHQYNGSDMSNKFLTPEKLIQWWNRITNVQKKYYHDIEMKSTLNPGRPDIIYISS